jgi:hypothetical protein
MVRGRKSRQRNSNNGAHPRSNETISPRRAKALEQQSIKWFEDDSRRFRSAYEAGEKIALWKTIVMSAIHKSAIPDWAASIIDGADGYVISGELNSWNELFGKPRLQSRSVLRARHLSHAVYYRIKDLQLRGTPINNDLFDRVGKELGIGARETVRKLYKAAKEEFDQARRKT